MDIRKFLTTLICSISITLSPTIFAQPQSPTTADPTGLWQTYDLSHTPRSIVQISTINGQLVGRIVKTQIKNAICSECKNDLHNKSVLGMAIIWGLKPEGDIWKKGNVLNVDNGKIYNCNVSVSADNKTLYFSPYVGIPGLGPTINWTRVDNIN